MRKPLLLFALIAPLFAGTIHFLAPITAVSSAAAPLVSSTIYTTASYIKIQADPSNAGGTCDGATIYVEDKNGNIGANLEPGGFDTEVAPGGGTILLNSIYIGASATSACIANVTYGTIN